jgi:group I intron endonuclease
METQYVYKITFLNGKCYIGRTKDINDRMYGHKRCAFHKNFNNSLYKAMRKYGEDSWIVEILAETKGEDSAQIIEEAFIKQFDSVRSGYNDTYGGSGRNMWKDNPELKEKQRKSLSERFSGDKNGMFGKTHSEEAKLKQKEKAKGRFSLEWYIDRNGKEAGQRMYDERRAFLSNRVMKRDEKGNFIKKEG